MRVFGIIGNCRHKVLLVQQLIVHLQNLGFAVSTIKRVSDDVDLDRPGKDTYRQRIAGAQEIVIANSFRSAILQEFRQPQDELDVDELLRRLKPVDLVLLEGFHLCTYPKAEALAAEQGRRPLYHGDDTVRAVVRPNGERAKEALLPGLRCFNLDETGSIALFILANAVAPGQPYQETAA